MDNETESKQVWDVSKDKSLGISSPMPAFLTWKGIIFYPKSDENIAYITSPRPGPNLLKAIGSIPSPRVRRFLTRETGGFES